MKLPRDFMSMKFCLFGTTIIKVGSNPRSIPNLRTKNYPEGSCQWIFEFPFQSCVLLINQKNVKFLQPKKQVFSVARELNELSGRTIIKMGSNLWFISNLWTKNYPQASCQWNFKFLFYYCWQSNSSTFLSVLSKQSSPH